MEELKKIYLYLNSGYHTTLERSFSRYFGAVSHSGGARTRHHVTVTRGKFYIIWSTMIITNSNPYQLCCIGSRFSLQRRPARITMWLSQRRKVIFKGNSTVLGWCPQIPWASELQAIKRLLSYTVTNTLIKMLFKYYVTRGIRIIHDGKQMNGMRVYLRQNSIT